MKKYYAIFLFSFLLPTLALAQCSSIPTSLNLAAGNTSTKFSDIICYVIGLINLLIPILFALAFILFFWGVSKYVLAAGEDKALKQGQQYMMWGVLALFVLTSYMAIIGIATNTFGFPTPSESGALLPTG